MSAPLCFVLMPFGRRTDPATGVSLDFDAIYRELIKPAIAEAGLEPIREDDSTSEPLVGPSFERLLLSEFAVIDVSAADFRSGFRIGARQALRPRRTVQVRARGFGLQHDGDPARWMAYGVTPGGAPETPDDDRRGLAALLGQARLEPREAGHGLIHLVDEARPSEISRLKTDVFRDRVELPEAAARSLAEARRQGAAAVCAARDELGPLSEVDTGVAVDLLLSFRAVGAWQEMIELIEAMPAPLGRSVMMQEQYALALNRAGRSDEAERVLLDLLASSGPTSETCSILGRVYKDRWQAALGAGDEARAGVCLRQAIETYLSGFESDWRDAFPGINVIQLMEAHEPPDPRRRELLPVVTYAVKHRIAAGEPDYWDHATLLELAALSRDRQAAFTALRDALAAVRETWEPASTAHTLRRLRAIRERRGEADAWLEELQGALEQAARELPGGS